MEKASPFKIHPADGQGDMDVARMLFGEYIAGLGVDLDFQDVGSELADLPGRYAQPEGVILVARNPEGEPVGCVALRPMAELGSCEIKRLYVREAARGQELGRRLAEAVLDHARQAGHRRVKLDTLATMSTARKLYISLGFERTDAYYANPLPGTDYMALQLRP